MIINQANLDIVFTGFQGIFNQAFQRVPTTWQTVAMEVRSASRDEKYGWMGDLPRLREWIGERHIWNLSAHDFTIKNRKFEVTISVDRDDVADDQFGVYRPVLAQMGQDAATHPDELVYGLLATGFTTVGYDGQFFFDTDHPVLDENGVETSVSNTGGGAGTAWFLIDASRMVKPLVFQKREDYELQRLDRREDENVFMQDKFFYGVRARVNAGLGLWQLAHASKQTLDAANFEAAWDALSSVKGDYGKRLGIVPTHLVYPTSLEGAARRVIARQANDAGAGNEWAGAVELLRAPWLD